MIFTFQTVRSTLRGNRFGYTCTRSYSCIDTRVHTHHATTLAARAAVYCNVPTRSGRAFAQRAREWLTHDGGSTHAKQCAGGPDAHWAGPGNQGPMRSGIAQRWGLRRTRAKRARPTRDERAAGSTSGARLLPLCLGGGGARSPDDDREEPNDRQEDDGKEYDGHRRFDTMAKDATAADGMDTTAEDTTAADTIGAAEITSEAAEAATANSACDAGQRRR
jgi:hypothetical protein